MLIVVVAFVVRAGGPAPIAGPITYNAPRIGDDNTTLMDLPKTSSTLCCLAFAMTLGGCATTGPPVAGDPWESFNRSMFAFNDSVDRAVLEPTARAYRSVVPGFVRTGISNVFGNLDDVVVTLNDLLQLKFAEATADLTRVVVNTTVGLYGLIDVASYLGVEKRNEDFGQTLGHYGVGPGPYLVVPFFGPSTLRDSGGGFVDRAVDPVFRIEDDEAFYGTYLLRAIDTRANLLGASDVARTAALDEYAFVRDAFLQRRLNLVHDGNPPRPGRDLPDDGGLEDLEALESLDGARQLRELDELDELEQLEELDRLNRLDDPAPPGDGEAPSARP